MDFVCLKEINCYMKVVISEPVLRGGCKDSNIRRLKDIDRRDLKFGVLTVHGSNFTKNKLFLKNLNFFGQEVLSKLGRTIFPL